MPRLCSFGCASSKAHMHVFPNPTKYPERFKTWVSIVGAKLETLSENVIYKKKKICDIHFLSEHKNRNNRLSALAVPLLHLPDESRSIAEAINSKIGPVEASFQQCGTSDTQETSQAIGDNQNHAETTITATCNFSAASGASGKYHTTSAFVESHDSVTSNPDMEHSAKDMESEEDEQWMSRADVCRCCLAASGTLDATATVVTDSGTEQVLSEMLQECFGIRLRLWGAGGGAGAVCAACAGQLRAAARFKRQVLRCDARFTRYWALEEMDYVAEQQSIRSSSSDGVVYSKSDWDTLEAGPTTAGKIDTSNGDAPKRPATDLANGPPHTKRQKQHTVQEFKAGNTKNNDLTVTISRADDVRLDEVAADVIENRLLDLRERAVIARVDAASLSLATSGLSDGRYLVTATTQDAKDWLLSCDFGTYNGVALIPRPIGRTKVSIFLPHSSGKYVDNLKENKKLPSDPLKLFPAQNTRRPEIWTIVNI